jgi:hypothetical protein
VLKKGIIHSHPKRNIIKRRGPRDVIAQAQATRKVVGPTLKERVGSDEKETGTTDPLLVPTNLVTF